MRDHSVETAGGEGAATFGQTTVRRDFGNLAAAQRGIYRRGVKRVLDLVLIALSTPVTVPMVALLVLLVAISSGGSPFYTQDRVGRGGKVFRLWKIRTMVRDSGRILEEYLAQNPERRREWDTHQKLDRDPRITWAGRLIRKTSLDELPQLWNVFTGDMSLVGPRPMMVSQQSLYHGDAYYRLRPGLTGPWQISSRNDVSFRGRVKFDTDYERNLSFMTDVKIILGTVLVVLKATGK